MRPMNLFQTTNAVLILLLSTLSCSDDDGPTPGCFQEDNRKIIEIVKDFSATILGPQTHDCPGDYIIEPDESLPNNIVGLLAPCNLGDEFKRDGLKVKVSGYIYESYGQEDICADFFEITEISSSL